MQRELVAEVFGDGGERLVKWATSASRRIAEYETHGTYLSEVYPKRAVFARFGNVETTARERLAEKSPHQLSKTLTEIDGKFTLSVSLHHYLQSGQTRRDSPKDPLQTA